MLTKMKWFPSLIWKVLDFPEKKYSIAKLKVLYNQFTDANCFIKVMMVKSKQQMTDSLMPLPIHPALEKSMYSYNQYIQCNKHDDLSFTTALTSPVIV